MRFALAVQAGLMAIAVSGALAGANAAAAEPKLSWGKEGGGDQARDAAAAADLTSTASRLRDRSMPLEVRAIGALLSTIAPTSSATPVDRGVDEFGFNTSTPGTVRVAPPGARELVIYVTGDGPRGIPRILVRTLTPDLLRRFESQPTEFVGEFLQRAERKLRTMIGDRRFKLHLRPVVQRVAGEVIFPAAPAGQLIFDQRRIPVARVIHRD